MLFWIWLLHTKPDPWWVSLCWIMVGKGPSALSPPPGQYPLWHTSSPVSSPVPEPLGFSSLPQGGRHFLWPHTVILLYLLHSFSRISYCLGTLRFYLYPCPVNLYIWWFTWSVLNKQPVRTCKHASTWKFDTTFPMFGLKLLSACFLSDSEECWSLPRQRIGANITHSTAVSQLPEYFKHL